MGIHGYASVSYTHLIMNDWEYRAKWYNEDEATAKAALPKMEDMATEEQDEVE